MLKSTEDRLFGIANNVILGIVILVVLYPLVFVASASISDPQVVMRGEMLLFPKDITFTAYERVFENPDVWTGFRNTFLYATVGTMLNVTLTIMGAYPLSRRSLPGRKAILLFLIFTMFFGGGLIPTYLVIKSLGLINTFGAMVVPGMISVYNLIVMRTFFENIPNDLHEAAMMDGSSNMHTLIRIVLPLSLPIIAVMVLFYGVMHWNAFFNGLIYLSDRSKYPLQLIVREILVQNQGQEIMNSADESAAIQLMIAESIKYALIIVTSIPILVLYPMLQRYFVKGIMIGAIKG